MAVIKERFVLDAEQSVLVVVDVQERLVKAMDEQVLAQLISNTGLLLDSATELQIPVLFTEQYKKGLGGTIPELLEKAADAPRFEKMSFSCCGGDDFVASLKATGRKQVVVAGMEAHVCVLQTVLDLIDAGFTVHLVTDAVMSRAKHNWKNAQQIVRQAGGVTSTAETVVFQWLKIAGTDSFKKISKLLR